MRVASQYPVAENGMRNAVSREATGLAARSIAGVVLGSFFAAQTSTGLAQTAAPMPDAGTESREVAEAFSHLDALAEELAERRGRIAQAAGGIPPPASLPPDPVPAPQTTSNGGPRPAPDPSQPMPREPSHCGTLEEITETFNEVEGHYDEYSKVITEVNGKLLGFRERVLDLERICEARFGEDVGYEIRRLNELDILGDQQHISGPSVCVDRLRREIDEKMSEEINTIRLQRMAVQLTRLTGMNNQIIDLERSLVRGMSKRDRLIQELEYIHEEIGGACQ